MTIVALLAFDPTVSLGNLLTAATVFFGVVFHVSRTMTIIDEIRKDQADSKKKQEEMDRQVSHHGERLATVEAVVKFRSPRSHGAD